MGSSKWKIIYYKTNSGYVPVFEFIENLDEKAKAKVVNTFSLLEEFGIRLGPPHAKKLKGTDLWELRILGSDNIRIFYVSLTNIAKLLYCNIHMDWNIHKKQLLKNPKVVQALKETELEYQVARAVIEARINKGLTQKDLAHKLHTTQSVISRVESAKTTPTLSFLKRLASALNLSLQVQFKP